MRSEYDFSRGRRGKFHRAGARLRVPVYLDASIHAQLVQRALARSMAPEDLATELLRDDLRVAPHGHRKE
jgi:hypothetical protein